MGEGGLVGETQPNQCIRITELAGVILNNGRRFSHQVRCNFRWVEIGRTARLDVVEGLEWGGAPYWLVCKMAILGSVYQYDKGREINKDANAICTYEATAGLGEVNAKAVERDD
jgi:hypothetical protein